MLCLTRGEASTLGAGDDRGATPGFVAIDGADIDVDRAGQWRAIACHDSQAHDNRVLRRRLALQGTRERVRLTFASAGRDLRPYPWGYRRGSVKA